MEASWKDHPIVESERTIFSRLHITLQTKIYRSFHDLPPSRKRKVWTKKSKSERKKESIVSWTLPWKKRVKMSQSRIEQPSPFQHQNISIGGCKKNMYLSQVWLGCVNRAWGIHIHKWHIHIGFSTLVGCESGNSLS